MGEWGEMKRAGSIQNNAKINRMVKNSINGRFLNHGNLCIEAEVCRYALLEANQIRHTNTFSC